MAPDRFFLFLGDADSDAAVSRLKAARVLYRKKQLDSKPENWRKITDLLGQPGLRGVIGTLNGSNYDQLVDPQYSSVSEELLVAVSLTPHVVFVHEQVMTGEEIPVQPPPVRTRSGWYDQAFALDFAAPHPAVRAQVAALFEQHRINVLPYRTNAERSVLAAAFIEDHERDLLLRVYVPHGRLYAEEMDRLLSLFRDWLSQVRRHTVRQDGYTTSAGRVYEFVGDGSLSPKQLGADMGAFYDFLDVCAESPESAERQLLVDGVDAAAASRLVSRYGKEKRRLDIDLRHARDSRLLDLRRNLESELLDAGDAGPASALSDVLEQFLPLTTDRRILDGSPAAAPPKSDESAGMMNVTINQQVIARVEGTVVQHLNGTAHLGAEARAVLELIDRFGGEAATELTTALHEVEDDDARRSDRLRARQTLKGFLIRVAGHGEKIGAALLQKYLESKVGV